MDLIIKNLEKLQDYYTKGDKHPIEKLVIDLDKLSEMEGFTKIFEKSCEKYVKVCANCKYCEQKIDEEPCRSCLTSPEKTSKWEPTLKEATERMQSEWDATGKDVKIFMNERIIKR